jgi:hypothetical protein
MQRMTGRSPALYLLVISFILALAAPAAAKQSHLSGVGVFGGGCPDPVAPFDDYPAIVMSGSLVGCWYTDVQYTKDNGTPSGVYLERGEELFVGTLDGQAGTFRTTYFFSSKWDPDVTTGAEVHGRCQHPIVAGSGTGAFAGATGRVDFKDDVTTGEYLYRGHIAIR